MVVVGLYQADQYIVRQQMIACGILQYRVGVFAVFVRNEVKAVQNQRASVRRAKRIVAESTFKALRLPVHG